MKKSVSIAILNTKNELLVLDHMKCKGLTTLPAGTIEEGESYLQTSVRESFEELGIRVIKQKLIVPPTVRIYDRIDGFKVYEEVVVHIEDFRGIIINIEPEKHSNLRFVSREYIMNNLDKVSESVVAASIFLQKNK